MWPDIYFLVTHITWDVLQFHLSNYYRAIIIDRVALAKQGDYVLGSIHPSVRLWTLSRLDHLTYDLGFGIRVDFDLGQGSR